MGTSLRSELNHEEVNLVTFSLVPSTPSSRREKGLVNLDTILGTGKYDSPTTAIQSAIACCINLNCQPDSRLISRLISLLQCRRSLVPRPSSAREERGRVWNITPGGSVPKEYYTQVIMTHNLAFVVSHVYKEYKLRSILLKCACA